MLFYVLFYRKAKIQLNAAIFNVGFLFQSKCQEKSSHLLICGNVLSTLSEKIRLHRAEWAYLPLIINLNIWNVWVRIKMANKAWFMNIICLLVHERVNVINIEILNKKEQLTLQKNQNQKTSINNEPNIQQVSLELVDYHHSTSIIITSVPFKIH